MLTTKLFSTMAIAGGVIFASACSAQAEDFNKEEIETIVHDYIMEHPEIISDAIYVLQERAEAEKAAKEGVALKEMSSMLLTNALDPVGGNPEGEITLVEFFDYNCGYCKRSSPVLQKLVENNPNLKVVYKEWPILAESSGIAARIALAINLGQPEYYDDFHHALLATKSIRSADDVWKVAKKVGADRDIIEPLLSDPKVSSHLQQTTMLAQQLGITGTPAFIVGDTIMKGAYPIEQIQKAIDEQS